MAQAPYFNRNGDLAVPVDTVSDWLREAAKTQGPNEFLFTNHIADEWDKLVAGFCLAAMDARSKS